jgi:hypothetical protein
LIGLRIVKRLYFSQFAVADLYAVEDLIYAKHCLHFKDCCYKISFNNMLLDLDALYRWQNTRQKSDHSVPPDQLPYPRPLKGNIRGEGYLPSGCYQAPSESGFVGTIQTDDVNYYLHYVCHT